jgi:hypothetical protein
MNASLLMAREPKRSESSPMPLRPPDLTSDLGNGDSFGRLLLSHGAPPVPLTKSLAPEQPARASPGDAAHRVSLEPH